MKWVLQVAGTQHKQVPGPPLGVESTPNNGLEEVEDVADLELVGRESL